MSQENVEALRRLFDLVGDGGNPEALYELLDSDVEMTISSEDLEGGRYVGHAGVREFFRRWAGTWETWHLHPERIIDGGQGQVVVGLHERGLGKGSGVEVEKRTGQVWTFRDGLVVRWENFNSLADALEAVGLRG